MNVDYLYLPLINVVQPILFRTSTSENSRATNLPPQSPQTPKDMYKNSRPPKLLNHQKKGTSRMIWRRTKNNKSRSRVKLVEERLRSPRKIGSKRKRKKKQYQPIKRVLRSCLQPIPFTQSSQSLQWLLKSQCTLCDQLSNYLAAASSARWILPAMVSWSWCSI